MVQDKIAAEVADARLNWADWEPVIHMNSGPTGADIEIVWEVGNDGYATVTIALFDTGNEEDGRKVYDADIHVSNNDNVGLLTMVGQLTAAVEQFYARGLNTRFGHVIGDDWL